MARRLNATIWRKIFLRALAHTGNVRVSAAEAGVDRETAYNHRAKDPAFAAKWATALEKAKALRLRSGQVGRKQGAAGELVLRRTKHGDKMVRAAPGRWSAGVEAAFFAALGRTGCVRAAARAAGISTTALYNRREAYPEFAERWRGVEAEALQRIPGLLAAATIASLDPDPSTRSGQGGRGRLPLVNVDQAIAISRLKGAGSGVSGAAAGRRGLLRKPVQSDDELKADLAKKLTSLMRRLDRKKMAKGWIRTDEGVMIPPGWTYVGTDPGGGGPDAG